MTAPPTCDCLAVGAFSSLDKNKELEGLEQKPSSNHIMNLSSCKPGKTPAPESICKSTAASEGTPSPQPQMSTPNMSDMINECSRFVDLLSTNDAPEHFKYQQ
ncbi:hypothetical protein PAAG_12680 [Paracoccidioides lutzii Pb01]|uniref:Uncharacterized protein n=1 Tax=Paracoccidioides lutzii (strain ATCC MYA-826 / Pb01) TaxID=502779 RepID=A0A0A2V2U6_PARBA|nr:hypothetical protein PAAG_12680 [Paracoccidioides lutzii Pb01]KGQ00657.1 hypothetical protein PAAG_12680 [Paracoccidioides lutzii Pb01]